LERRPPPAASEATGCRKHRVWRPWQRRRRQAAAQAVGEQASPAAGASAGACSRLAAAAAAQQMRALRSTRLGCTTPVSTGDNRISAWAPITGVNSTASLQVVDRAFQFSKLLSKACHSLGQTLCRTSAIPLFTVLGKYTSTCYQVTGAVSACRGATCQTQSAVTIYNLDALSACSRSYS
jgi:hypothetical protein